MLTQKVIAFKARFDGSVIIPEGPVNLPTDQVLDFRVSISPNADNRPTLQKLAELARTFPANPDSPGDASVQHDHYLYGTPKRDNP